MLFYTESLYAGASGQRMGSAPLLTTVTTQKLPAINNGTKSCIAPIQQLHNVTLC